MLGHSQTKGRATGNPNLSLPHRATSRLYPRAEQDGLRAVPSGCMHTPESLTIDEVVRFEGMTNPDDEAIVFAVRCGVHGTRGTYVTAYGPQMSAVDAEMVRRLSAS
jgi:hypothetical protein